MSVRRMAVGGVVVLGVLSLAACGTSSGSGGGGFVGGTSSGAASSSGASSSGGSSSSSGGGGTPCAAVASAVCGKLFDCTPVLAMPWFGDKAKCEERYKAGCERNLKLPDVSASLGTALQSCASSIGGKSCDAMLSASTLTCLNAAGTRDNGLPCSRHVQCKSAYCKAVANEECGVCAGKKGDGGDCTSTDGCEVGLDCIGGKCGKKTIAQPGEACDDKTKPCKFGYGCVGNVCKKQGEAGASCDPAAKSNDCSVLDKLLYCKEDAKTCAKITVAEGTGECPGVAICKAGYCPTSGKCIPRVGDGEDCDEATGKFCMLPARCVKGICTLASPNKCN